jgi:hypothetical protein
MASNYMNGDRRRVPRRRLLKGAIAAFSDRYCTIPCTVRNLSHVGALLTSKSASSIPDRFELIIELDGIEVQCEIVWRKEFELGVRFLDYPRQVEPRRYQIIESVEDLRCSSTEHALTVARAKK